MVHGGRRSEAWRTLWTFKIRCRSIWRLSFTEYAVCSDSLLTVGNGGVILAYASFGTGDRKRVNFWMKIIMGC